MSIGAMTYIFPPGAGQLQNLGMAINRVIFSKKKEKQIFIG
jgi:hypothetical protein